MFQFEFENIKNFFYNLIENKFTYYTKNIMLGPFTEGPYNRDYND